MLGGRMNIPDEVKRLALAGDKVRAIKALREVSGLSLKEALRVVEALAAGGEVQLGSPEPASRDDETKEQRVRRQVENLGRAGRPGILQKKEIAELPKILADDEDVLDLVQGSYGSGLGVLVATQKRLIFVDKGMLYGLKVEDFPLDKISSIQYDTGLLLGSITIFTSGNKAEIKNVDKGLARTFAETARSLIGNPNKGTTGVRPSGIDELERLVALKEKGYLTEEEFTIKKRQILGL
jgi:hypothetical protein